MFGIAPPNKKLCVNSEAFVPVHVGLARLKFTSSPTSLLESPSMLTTDPEFNTCPVSASKKRSSSASFRRSRKSAKHWQRIGVYINCPLLVAAKNQSFHLFWKRMNLRRISSRMAGEVSRSAEQRTSPAAVAAAYESDAVAAAVNPKSKSFWPSVLRWIPTSTDKIIAAEKRLLSLVK